MKACQCAVAPRSSYVLDETQRLAESVHELRRVLRSCQRCSCTPTCGFIQSFNSQFENALQYVMVEWNLASTV